MKKIKNKLFLLSLLLTALSGTVNAQVTIGSEIEPVNGAILDLKQVQTNDGSANSALGLMLPRVKLTDVDKLSGGAAITGVSESQQDKDTHIGLTVYHVGDCPGVYSWDGTQWIRQMPPCPPPANKWSGSNVYFVSTGAAIGDGITDAEAGYLTFDETHGDKEGYQGLFFKWGSLVGVAAGAEDVYDSADTYLYIPDLTTGKYYKVKSGQIAGVAGTGTPIGAAVSAYKAMYTNGEWMSIPYATSTDIDGSGAGRDDNRLTTQTASLKASYKGDICRFLTLTKSTNGNNFAKSWRMPVSNEFSMGTTPNPSYSPSPFSSTDPNGTGKNDETLYYYTYTGAGALNGNEVVTFPPAGYRRDGDGYLKSDGVWDGYWSASCMDWGNAYDMSFMSGWVNCD